MMKLPACRFCGARPPVDPVYYNMQGTLTRRPSCKACLERKTRELMAVYRNRSNDGGQREAGTAQREYDDGRSSRDGRWG